MPDTSTLVMFALTALVLVAVPGPNLIYIITRSVSEGRPAGLVSAAGVETGTLVHVAAAAVGVSALLASSAAAFAIVKYAGAAYLVYLGLRALLRKQNAPSPRSTEHRTLASTARPSSSSSSTPKSRSSSSPSSPSSSIRREGRSPSRSSSSAPS